MTNVSIKMTAHRRGEVLIDGQKIENVQAVRFEADATQPSRPNSVTLTFLPDTAEVEGPTVLDAPIQTFVEESAEAVDWYREEPKCWRWDIGRWAKERLTRALLGAETVAELVRESPVAPSLREDGRAWLRFDGMRFDPTNNRVSLLLGAEEVAVLIVPAVEGSGTLTVTGEIVGYIPFRLE